MSLNPDRTRTCPAGPAGQRELVVRQGRASLLLNPQTRQTLTGTVGAEGSVRMADRSTATSPPAGCSVRRASLASTATASAPMPCRCRSGPDRAAAGLPHPGRRPAPVSPASHAVAADGRVHRVAQPTR
ncbi:hypothetical protein ACFQU2_34730 [Siccirubricoccus deserti]